MIDNRIVIKGLMLITGILSAKTIKQYTFLIKNNGLNQFHHSKLVLKSEQLYFRFDWSSGWPLSVGSY